MMFLRRAAWLALGLMLAIGAVAAAAERRPAPPKAGSILLTPDVITDERALTLEVQRGLLFVPENRRVRGSRIITVHFLRVPAARATPHRAPVFMLPGGPGWDFDLTDPLVFDEVQRLRQTREVLIVSQRGYASSPGLAPDLKVTFPEGNPETLVTAQQQAERDRSALSAAMQAWRRRGVDLTGYDILNITEDLNDLRASLGYGKIVLRGCSFGSQWGLAYMRRWPATVERAMFSGVEPLDRGYDSPEALWASLGRVARAAEADPDFAHGLPPGGVLGALQAAVLRLEASSVNVTIQAPSGEGPIVVQVGADDLRQSLLELAFGKRRPLENLAQWPRFVLEIYNGDYRYLAVRTAQRRARQRSEALILALINHSIGIGSARADELAREPAARWLGDVNLKEHVTRAVAPTSQVDNSFRTQQKLAIPTLLIAGDYDWSTPLENAEELLGSFAAGNLVRVHGGRHCTETNFGELSAQAPDITRQLYAFIDADLGGAAGKAFRERLPRSVTLAPIDFAPVTPRSLYEEWLDRR